MCASFAADVMQYKPSVAGMLYLLLPNIWYKIQLIQNFYYVS